MNQYMVFAVVLQPASVVIRRDSQKQINAQNMEAAMKEAGDTVPLQVGETLAITLIKKAK